jgi:hypothetical protein
MRPTRPGAAFLIALMALAACDERDEHEARNMSAEEVGDQLSNLRIAPGLWELASDVVEVHADDLPREVQSRMVGPRSRLRHCITPAQAARPSANFLAGRTGNDCVYRNFSVEGGRVNGAMSCRDTSTVMQGVYGPRAYDLRMDVSTPLPTGVTMTLKVRSRGRQIGPC